MTNLLFTLALQSNEMKTLFKADNIEVTAENYGWPIGKFYRVTDGITSFTMDECPPLDENNLRALITSYRYDRMEELAAEAAYEGETHCMTEE